MAYQRNFETPGRRSIFKEEHFPEGSPVIPMSFHGPPHLNIGGIQLQATGVIFI